MIRAFALIFMTLFLMNQSFANPTHKVSEQFIRVSNDLEIFVRYTPATGGKTTLVILNGLTHTTQNWNKFLQHLQLSGEGLLQIDLAGQGETLAAHGAVTDIIRYQDQTTYVARVLASLGITKDVTLIGLSYGGGIATYFAEKNPQLIGRLILMAPYNEPQPEQDKWIRQQIEETRIAFPYNPSSDDELYDYFLRQLVYTTYPSGDSTLMTTPFKLEAVYRMAQGIRKLRTALYVGTLPAKSVFLIGGSADQVVHPWELDNLWHAIPDQAKASRMILTGTNHDIIELEPKATAQWVQRILANDPQTLSGKTTVIQP